MHKGSRDALIDEISSARQTIAAGLLRRRMAPLLKLDLSLQQLRTVLLVATGTATTGGEVAAILHVKPPTVSVLVERLVELGYLERVTASGDRRQTRLRATPAAIQLRDDILGADEVTTEVLGRIDDGGLTALAAGMRALAVAIHDDDGPVQQ